MASPDRIDDKRDSVRSWYNTRNFSEKQVAASPDRKDDKRDTARTKQAALDAKNAKTYADERKRKSDLYKVAAKKAEKNFKNKFDRTLVEDEGYKKSVMTKEELLRPLGKPEWSGEGPINDLSRYADEQTEKRGKAQRRIKNRTGKVWTRFPDGSYGYKMTKGQKN